MQILDNKDRLGALLVLVFSLVYLRYALVIPLDPTASESFTPRTLPVGLAIAAIVVSFVQLALSARSNPHARITDAVRGFRWKPTLGLLALMTAYSLAFEWLGFVIASFLFLLSGFLILGERRIVRSVAVAAVLVAVLWLMLSRVFGLYLDSGELLRLLPGVPA